jgi:hypothetical protein
MFIGVNIRNNPLNTLKWNTKTLMFKPKKTFKKKIEFDQTLAQQTILGKE